MIIKKNITELNKCIICNSYPSVNDKTTIIFFR